MAATGAVKMELRWLRMAGGRVVSSASSAGSVSLQVWVSSASSVSPGSSAEFASSASAAVLRVLRALRIFFNGEFSEWVR